MSVSSDAEPSAPAGAAFDSPTFLLKSVGPDETSNGSMPQPGTVQRRADIDPPQVGNPAIAHNACRRAEFAASAVGNGRDILGREFVSSGDFSAARTSRSEVGDRIRQSGDRAAQI
jgi:hypothetical protein